MTENIHCLSITLTVNAIDKAGRHVDATSIPLPEDLLRDDTLVELLDEELLHQAGRLRREPDEQQRAHIEAHISNIMTIYTMAARRLAVDPF